MTRTPEEIAADEVMEHIAALHSNPFSTHNRSVIAHLTTMHKLRDQEFMLNCYLHTDVISGYEWWIRELEAMQTF